jgi:ubiquinone/menaquinone biosynthesis C-methylase UbiE
MSFNAVVFDPPYAHDPGRMIVDDAYRNAETCRGCNHNDIIALYRQGLLEACRILKPGGRLFVKCQDEIDQSIQRWSHLEIALIAQGMQLYIRDLFILMQTAKPAVQHRQQHARKNHSYLWVFEKVPTTDRRLNIQRVSL